MASRIKPIERYGKVWPAGVPDWAIELAAYRMAGKMNAKTKEVIVPGALTKHQHFINASNCFWGHRQSSAKFVWHPWAEDMLDAAVNNSYVGLCGASSCGKCLSPDTLVLMSDGASKAAKDVVVGDRLMGDDSTPRNVVSTTTGRSNMVKIVPSMGDAWECNDDHILTLKRAHTFKKKDYRRVGEVIDISVKDFLKTSKRFQSIYKLFIVPVEFPAQDVEFDPRMYGIWLGDGSKLTPEVTVHQSETEITEFLTGYFSKIGYHVSIRSTNGCPLISAHTGPGGGRNPLRDFFHESCGVTKQDVRGGNRGEKRILSRYLFNTREVRMQLLAGLLDADGCAKKTMFEIVSAYPRLAKDIVFLSRSLGFRVTTRDRYMMVKGVSHRHTVIQILGDTHTIPTLRKKCWVKKTSRDSTCSAFKVEQLGDGDWAGFELDGNSRFLLSDFTVTHNSRFMAVWGLLNWLTSPSNTLCLMTSTTIRDAKGRVWGAVSDYYHSGVRQTGIGKLVTSPTPAIYTMIDGQRREDAGLILIPADAKKSAEVTSKIRGLKQKRVLLVADELSELGLSLLDTAMSNLSNNPMFHMIGAANPKSYHDAFGQFVKPKLGWKSICVEDDRWEMSNGGVCLHFDMLKNPNYIARENLWPIQSYDKVTDLLEKLDPDSPALWRDGRAFWCPSGFEASIYSEVEIAQYGGDQKAVWSGARKIPVAGLDPSFSGGDRMILYTGFYGDAEDGGDTIEFERYYEISEDVTDKKVARNVQTARKVIQILEEHDIPIRNLGVDSTSGGNVWCDILANESGSNDFFRVNFGSRATERAVSTLDPTPANEKYKNRVSELWCVGVEYLRAKQLKGIGSDLIREMTERRYETTRSSGDTKLSVEPKIKMKARTGKSPDIADAAFVLLDLCRERFSLRSEDAKNVQGVVSTSQPQAWRQAVSRLTPRLNRPRNIRR